MDRIDNNKMQGKHNANRIHIQYFLKKSVCVLGDWGWFLMLRVEKMLEVSSTEIFAEWAFANW